MDARVKYPFRNRKNGAIMEQFILETPVVIIILNRPDCARSVFAEVRKAKPKELFIVADGPRQEKAGEREKCLEARTIAEQVDWDCTVHTDFSDANLGCKNRVVSGLDWVFSLTETAIILEDDCKPAPGFFRYCQELLHRYKDDERIMIVSGDNKLFANTEIRESYYFSRYVNMWGWATWRRAWKCNDPDMKSWPDVKKDRLFDQYFTQKSERYYWTSLFDFVHEGRIDTWDYQWVYSIWLNSGMAAAPKTNLISNIGFDTDATHTKNSGSIYANSHADDIDFPLVHPPYVLINAPHDETERKMRIRESQRLPYPLTKWASAAKRIFRGNRKTT